MIPTFESSGVKPTLGSKPPPSSGTLLPEMEKKSSGFFISYEGKRHLIKNVFESSDNGATAQDSEEEESVLESEKV